MNVTVIFLKFEVNINPYFPLVKFENYVKF